MEITKWTGLRKPFKQCCLQRIIKKLLYKEGSQLYNVSLDCILKQQKLMKFDSV